MSDDAPSGGAESSRIEEAVGFLRSRIPDLPDAGLVLGSGMAHLTHELLEPLTIAFDEVPHWPAPEVEGHRAQLVVGHLGGVSVAMLAGRVHLYEGYPPSDVVRAVRSLCHLGIKTFLLSNAAGAIAGNLKPGDLMVIRDHINLTGCSPLTGPAEPMLGPRFPDQSEVYSGRLRPLLGGDERVEGVYAGMLGPAYETPAEVRMLQTMGASAVGMSTVHEAIALNAMGAELAGLSLITNRAAGLADTALSHDEVLEASRGAMGELTQLITDFCSKL